MARTNRGYLPVNFSAVCNIFSSVLGTEISQLDIIELLFSFVYPTDDQDHREAWLDLSASTVCKYFNNQHGVDKKIQSIARENITDLIQSNFERRVYLHMNLNQKQSLLLQFQELVNRLPQDDDPMNLHSYLGIDVPAEGENRSIYTRFIAKCIRFALLLPNTESAKIQWGIFNDAPSVSRKSDPYRLVYQDPGSSVVTIKLIDEIKYSHIQKFYNFELLTENILRKNLILRRISCETGTILVRYTQFHQGGFQFRRLKKSDFPAARDFICFHSNEFRKKRSWRGRELCDMVYNGLCTGMWTAYGYFDPAGRIIAYLDAKYRQDGGIELGVLLTDPAYRGTQLASSLIYFFQLLFPHNRIFGGTYVENSSMRNTFSSTNFTQIQYYDSRLSKRTSTVKERIDPAHPDDTNYDTDSVYYFAESLLVRAYRAVLKKRR